MGLSKEEEQLILSKYHVTSDGDIFLVSGKRLKKLVFDGRYYSIDVSLPRGSTKMRAHRLVALKYIPNPLNLPHINHKNGIKTDNRVENLEWTTRSDNQKHAVRLGLIKTGEDSHMTKYPDSLFERLKEFRAKGVKIVNLARITGINDKYLGEILRGKKRVVAV